MLRLVVWTLMQRQLCPLLIAALACEKYQAAEDRQPELLADEETLLEHGAGKAVALECRAASATLDWQATARRLGGVEAHCRASATG